MAADGRLIVTGGVIGWDTKGVLSDDFVAQVRQTLDNIVAILAEGGAKPEHLVRLTWYVVDIEEYLADPKALGRAYRETIGAHYPAMMRSPDAPATRAASMNSSSRVTRAEPRTIRAVRGI